MAASSPITRPNLTSLLSRPTHPRTVRILIRPPTQTLSETRAVLRALRSHAGEVVSLQSHRADSSSTSARRGPGAGAVMAVFRDDESARRMLAGARLRVDVDTGEAWRSPSYAEVQKWGTDDEQPKTPDDAASDARSAMAELAMRMRDASADDDAAIAGRRLPQRPPERAPRTVLLSAMRPEHDPSKRQMLRRDYWGYRAHQTGFAAAALFHIVPAKGMAVLDHLSGEPIPARVAHSLMDDVEAGPSADEILQKRWENARAQVRRWVPVDSERRSG